MPWVSLETDARALRRYVLDEQGLPAEVYFGKVGIDQPVDFRC